MIWIHHHQKSVYSSFNQSILLIFQIFLCLSLFLMTDSILWDDTSLAKLFLFLFFFLFGKLCVWFLQCVWKHCHVGKFLPCQASLERRASSVRLDILLCSGDVAAVVQARSTPNTLDPIWFTWVILVCIWTANNHQASLHPLWQSRVLCSFAPVCAGLVSFLDVIHEGWHHAHVSSVTWPCYITRNPGQSLESCGGQIILGPSFAALRLHFEACILCDLLIFNDRDNQTPYTFNLKTMQWRYGDTNMNCHG